MDDQGGPKYPYKSDVEGYFTIEECDVMTSGERFKDATAGFEDRGRAHKLRHERNTVLDTERQGS